MMRVVRYHMVYRLLDVALHMDLLPHIVSKLRNMSSIFCKYQSYEIYDVLYVTEQILRKADADQQRKLLHGDQHGLIAAVRSIRPYAYISDMQREAEMVQKLLQNLCEIQH